MISTSYGYPVCNKEFIGVESKQTDSRVNFVRTVAVNSQASNSEKLQKMLHVR